MVPIPHPHPVPDTGAEDIGYQSLGNSLGDDDARPPLPASALRAALASNEPALLGDELAALSREAREGRLTSAGLHLPFATATLPCMRAIIDGIDLLRQTGKLRPAALRELMEPSFRLTGAAVVGTDGMSVELERATALVAEARRRWSDAASHGRGPD